MKKRLLTILLALAMLLIPSAVFAEGEEGAVPDGWNADRTMYYENGAAVTGLFKAKMSDDVGALFYAGADGIVVKTPGLVTVSYPDTRFIRSADPEGHVGFREVSSTDMESYTYLIGHKEGAIVETAQIYDSGKGKYIVQANGTVMTKAGFVKVNGLTYYVNSSGRIRTKAGWLKINGKKYRVKDGGAIRTKEGAFSANGYRYVIPAKSKDGAIATKRGVYKAKNWLYFVRNSNGLLGKNLAYKIGKKVYHVNKKGVVRVGKHKWKNGKYYFSTKKGYLRTKAGIITRNGRRFCVKQGGLIITNKKFSYKGNYYISNKSGYIYTDMFKWNGNLYYASSKGVLKKKAGIIEHNGYDYFVAGGGLVYVNKMFYWNGKLYAADGNGHLETGLFRRGGTYYFADADHSVRTSEEILKYKGKYYFNKRGGGLARNQWINVNNKHYYAGDDAAFITTRFKKDGAWFNPSSNGEISDEEYKQLFPDPEEKDEDEPEEVNNEG